MFSTLIVTKECRKFITYKFVIVVEITGHTITEVIENMSKEIEQNKKQQMEKEERKAENKFNSVTQSVKPHNQNQQHNVRREGTAQINQKR